MEPLPRTIEIYITEDGDAPFAVWLDRLRDRRARAQIQRRLARVRLGLLGECKALGDGVYELRIDMGPGYRIYFAQVGQTVVLLLCGGDKSAQAADIAKAKAAWADYQDRTS
jgi:putative addiction module killer protein